MQIGDRPDPYGIVGGLLFSVFCRAHSGARAQNFRKCVAHVRKTARRMFPAGRFDIILCAYQRTVRGAAAKELNVAVASVSASTCVLPSSAAYMLCSSG